MGAIKDKTSGKSADVLDLVKTDESGNLLNINGDTELTIDNSNKFNGKTEEEFKIDINAATVGGKTADELKSSDKSFKVRKLLDSKMGHLHYSMAGIGYNNELVNWGQNYEGIWLHGSGNTTRGIRVKQMPIEKKNIEVLQFVPTRHCVFILYADGDLYCFGTSQASGHLGLNHTADVVIPTLTATNVKSVHTHAFGHHVNENSTFIIKNNNFIYSCGDNYDGQLGRGDTANKYNWGIVTLPDNVGNPIDIQLAGTEHALTFVLTDTGKVLSCGYGGYGGLGVGSNTNLNQFVQINTLDGHFVTQIETGGGANSAHYENSTHALTIEGKVFAWGNNTWGQLGLVDGNNISENNLPIEITYPDAPYDAISNKIVKLHGDSRAYAAARYLETENGDIFATGYNAHGELGLNDTSEKQSFKFVMGNVKIFRMAHLSDSSHYGSMSYAVTKDNKLYSWGLNTHGALGQYDTTNRLVPTEVQFGFTDKIEQIEFTSGTTSDLGDVYLRLSDGSVYGCGANDEYQVDINYDGTYVSHFVKIV